MSYFSGLIFGIITTLGALFIFMPFNAQGVLAKNTEKHNKTSFNFFNKTFFEVFRWFTL